MLVFAMVAHEYAHAVTAPDQLLVSEQGGGDHEGLGDSRVGDLLGGGGGAQAGQVQAGDRRPRLDPFGGTGQFEPRREHAGRLRSLSGSKQCEHVFKKTLWERICAV